MWPAFSRSPRASLTAPALVLAASALWPVSGWAFFGDDEARKAIIDLRQRVEVIRQSLEATRQAVEVNRQATDTVATEARDAQAVTRRSQLDLALQLDQLREEVARLRGQQEQLLREVSEQQRLQKLAQEGIEQRLRQLEPAVVSYEGVNFTAKPGEVRDFESAMEVLRRAEFEPAVSAFTGFLRRYPESGYVPSAWYWLGNAQYAIRAYKDSMESHKRLITAFPNHQRTPEAMLAVANSHIELKETTAARNMLEALIKQHPTTEAAVAARERLARLR